MASSLASASTLYICYFGVREPLVQTQVVPYLRQLTAAGVRAHLLTFEPQPVAQWPTDERDAVRARLAAQGIGWHALTYHKRPTLPATLYDIARGAQFARRLIRRERLDIIHARSHVAAAMGALAKRGTRARLLFDIRGFMPEEYTDAGVWPAGGHLYKLAKAAERRLLAAADGYVVLTEKARQILFPDAAQNGRARPVEVIPCCVDLAHFRGREAAARAEVRRELGVAARRVLVYVGSLGGWYLTDEMADLLAAAHRADPATFALILTQSPPAMITERLAARGLGPEDYLVRRVSPAEMPRYLSAADAALSFIKPCYSKLSSSPTKMAEYLAAGLPVICNAGVGDVDELIETDRVGVLLREFDEASYRAALAELAELERDPDLRARCRRSADARLDLTRIGGPRYRRLYERLLAGARG
ncbi:MAG TPA: glycosyltransferase [Pyrinomonadaceae bacterium]|jgi:glycosyltransferase involved in cell wall biosynthesis